MVNWLEPGPVIVMFEVITNELVEMLIVPTTLKVMVSVPLLLPAAHSPAAAPEGALVFAAAIASRKVHLTSLPSQKSVSVFTVIVASAVIPPLSGSATAAEE